MAMKEELDITAICASGKLFARRILPPHDAAHMTGIEEQGVAVDVG
jgi:hypothetical protein